MAVYSISFCFSQYSFKLLSFGPLTFFYIYLQIFMGCFFFAFETLIYSPILLKLALFANWKLTEFYILGKRKLSDFMITISNSF